jgi:hypothetical protein
MGRQNSDPEQRRYESFLKLFLTGHPNEALFELTARHIPAEDVKDKFKLDDSVIYKWSIHNPFKFHLHRQIIFFLFSAFSAAATGMLIGFVPLWLIGIKWETFAFYAGVLAFLVLVLQVVRQHWLALAGPTPIRLLVQNNLPFFSAIAAVTLLFVVSSPAPIIRDGFGGSTDSLIQWMLFLLDDVANVVLLDFPDKLGLRLSSIQPHLWYSRLASQTLQLLIAVGVIDLIVLLYRLTFSAQEFYGTVFEAAARCHALANNPGQLRREGRLDVIPRPDVVDLQVFRRNMTEGLQFLQHAEQYRARALKGGGGTTEGAIRWLYRHRPPERFSSLQRINAWLYVLKSFQGPPENDDAPTQET